jgi:hypothetical protein
MMRHVAAPVVALLVTALTGATGISRASNDDARIVLHAQPYTYTNTCTTPQDSLGLNCDGVRPTVSVAARSDIEVYVYLQNYTAVAAAQMAFEWDASWSFFYWIGNCQSNEVLGTGSPQTSGDSYIGAFDAVVGGALAPLGRMRFTAGTVGTQLNITQTWAPGGTGVVDDVLVFVPIPSENWGMIGVQIPGIDSCGGESKSRAFF